ncbi:hypothetical protein LPB86_09150 [Pedobacter sp. MC2016-14]|uniref:hypothetical protein n=1 Tax=Pedobacter sp. MC2016-14 TaxID=2897327 RepID=UPI001E3D4D6E|nr:hypothetical protein [Pedobacter sp. MC2016-14]MCD0488396.1 hypothetical protein [Pedobacter sp. MC2016-14]
MSLTSSRIILFLFLISHVFLAGCNHNSSSVSTVRTDNNYSLYILGKDGKEYILETASLDSGILLPEKDGAALNVSVMDRNVLVKNGYYYHMNRKANAFVKYNINHQVFKSVSSSPLQQFSTENYYWMGSDTLLLTGLQAPEFAQAQYALLRTTDMKVLAKGNMDIPKPTGRFETISIGFVKQMAKKLLVGYTYHEQLSATDYTTSDTIYVTELNYPNMRAVKTVKDGRSTYPGGMNTVQSSSFTDEKQDFYFMACPGIALGNRPELSTAIMKIGKGVSMPDQKYFFNLSDALRNHAYGMWYLGNGKAIVRSERKDLYKDLDDHYSTAHFEFYLIDIYKQRVINKLNLPLDRGTRRECILVQGNKAYISISSITDGNFIWCYDIQTGKLNKGLQLAGNSDYILRIDKLK